MRGRRSGGGGRGARRGEVVGVGWRLEGREGGECFCSCDRFIITNSCS